MTQKNGFTLVELMIVVSIIGILSTAGILSYLSFSRKQLLVQSAEMVRQDLLLAQSLAINNQKPSTNCDTLISYVFRVLNSCNYQIESSCSKSSGMVNTPIKQASLPKNVTISGLTAVEFKILRQGVVFTGGNTLTLSSSFGGQKVITINAGGAVSISQ